MRWDPSKESYCRTCGNPVPKAPNGSQCPDCGNRISNMYHRTNKEKKRVP